MTDALVLLAAADPLRDTAPTAAESARMDAGLHRLVATTTTAAAATTRGTAMTGAAATTGAPASAGAPARRRAARRSRVQAGRRWLAVPLVAAAAGVVALAAPDDSPRPLRPAPATAATVLTELGHRVAAAPAESGRYAYQRTLSYVSHMRPKPGGKGTFVVVLAHVDEQWVGDDGKAIARNRVEWDEPTFPTAEDKADYEAAGPNRPPGWSDGPHAVDDPTVLGLTPAAIRALPTDPAALRAALENPDVQLTATIGALLTSALTPVEVKVALFEVLKGLPGATLVDHVTDPRGRTGVGVRFQDEAWDTLFLFNPRTGQLLGTRSIGHKEVAGRDIDDWSLVLDSGRRDSAPTPTGRTLTIPVA